MALMTAYISVSPSAPVFSRQLPRIDSIRRDTGNADNDYVRELRAIASVQPSVTGPGMTWDFSPLAHEADLLHRCTAMAQRCLPLC